MRAAIRYRKTFYHCTCPDPPENEISQQFMFWLFEHYKKCKPRKIVDVHLPPLEEGE